MLEDIAILTNGRAVTEDLGIKLESLTLEDLGQAKKVTIDKDNTTIIEGAGSADGHRRPRQAAARAGRRHDLRLRPREAAGAARQAGRRRRDHQGRRGDRDRDEGKEGARRGRDARDQGGGRRRHRRGRRRRAAARGGGARRRSTLDGDEQIGVKIISRAIEEPMRWIATNAGHEGSIVVQRVKEMKGDEGFNAQTEQYEDLVRGRRDRSDQGGPLGAAERRVDRLPAADDRSGHLPDSRSRPARVPRWQAMSAAPCFPQRVQGLPHLSARVAGIAFCPRGG